MNEQERAGKLFYSVLILNSSTTVMEIDVRLIVCGDKFRLFYCSHGSVCIYENLTGSHLPMSPVCSQPSLSRASAVFSGSFRYPMNTFLPLIQTWENRKVCISKWSVLLVFWVRPGTMWPDQAMWPDQEKLQLLVLRQANHRNQFIQKVKLREKIYIW